MSKKMQSVIIIFLVAVLFNIAVSAQFVSVRGLPNGLNVATIFELTIDGKKVSSARPSGMSYETSQDNVIRRGYSNFTKKEFYGYELEIEKTNEINKYKITIKPPSETFLKLNEKRGSPVKSLIKTPISKIVDDGDTIVVDIFENPEEKEKATDYIKITKEYKPFGNYFPEKNDSPAKDFDLEDVELKLSKFDIFVNREKIGQVGGGVMGSLVWINFPEGKNKGRFVFSIIPHKGYNFQKAGVLKDYTIEFNFNGDNYQIVSSVPIISTNKTWNLWVLYDPDYKSELSKDGKKFEVGVADKAEYLFHK